ncbi:MAG: hypothetical protein ABI828_01970 [Actinomycetota bacterium]
MSASHGTSRYGPVFWAAVAVGWMAIAFGAVSALTHWGAVDPPQFLVWIVGLALLHDLVMAPVVSLAGRTLKGARRRWWLGAVEAALAVSAVITLFAVPFVMGWGRQADNPSLLPRNYGFGLILILGSVWAVAGIRLLGRRRRREVVVPSASAETS